MVARLTYIKWSIQAGRTKQCSDVSNRGSRLSHWQGWCRLLYKRPNNLLVDTRLLAGRPAHQVLLHKIPQCCYHDQENQDRMNNGLLKASSCQRHMAEEAFAGTCEGGVRSWLEIFPKIKINHDRTCVSHMTTRPILTGDI